MEKEHLVEDLETGSSPNEFHAYTIALEQLNQINAVGDGAPSRAVRARSRVGHTRLEVLALTCAVTFTGRIVNMLDSLRLVWPCLARSVTGHTLVAHADMPDISERCELRDRGFCGALMYLFMLTACLDGDSWVRLLAFRASCQQLSACHAA